MAKSLFELADGRKVEETTYLAEVSFDGKRREIVFHFTDSADSLIGASLLKEKRLDLRYRRRRVTIRDDP
ncbi:MAG: hypothetical protein HYY93_08040 [Planctomycetes bacterium]|nr:hypothetical protein [Planctomycetota bacterium]